jgi:hypothetical protein
MEDSGSIDPPKTPAFKNQSCLFHIHKDITPTASIVTVINTFCYPGGGNALVASGGVYS